MPDAPAPSLSAERNEQARSCPRCGQHVDRANIRCPRCRHWFVPPRPPDPWRRVRLVSALVVLAVASFVAGMMMQRMWSPVPPDVVVIDETELSSDPPR